MRCQQTASSSLFVVGGDSYDHGLPRGAWMILGGMRNREDGKKGMTSDGSVDTKKKKRKPREYSGASGAVQLNAPGAYSRISEQDTWEVGGSEGLW